MKVTGQAEEKADFKAPSAAKRLPRALADGIGGMVLAVAEVGGFDAHPFLGDVLGWLDGYLSSPDRAGA